MAKRGPKPVDKKILRIRSIHAGSAGAKPKELGTEETPRRPMWLIGEGRKKWEMLMPQLKNMGVLATVDRDLLALYCKVYGEWREADQLVKSLLVKTTAGNIVQHPAVSLRNAAFDRLCKLGKEFGLTPAARTALAIRKKKKPSSEKSRFFGAKKPGA